MGPNDAPRFSIFKMKSQTICFWNFMSIWNWAAALPYRFGCGSWEGILKSCSIYQKFAWKTSYTKLVEKTVIEKKVNEFSQRISTFPRFHQHTYMIPRYDHAYDTGHRTIVIYITYVVSAVTFAGFVQWFVHGFVWRGWLSRKFCILNLVLIEFFRLPDPVAARSVKIAP